MPGRYFRTMSMQQKFILLILSVSWGALLMFSVLAAFIHIRVLSQAMVDKSASVSASLAQLSGDALSASDRAAVANILMSLRTDSGVETAVVYDEKNTPIAVYHKSGNPQQAELPETPGVNSADFIFLHGRYLLEMFRPIQLEDKHIGTVYMLSNTDRLAEQVRAFVLYLLLGLSALLLVSALFATILLKRMVRPLSALAGRVRKIVAMGNSAWQENGSHEDMQRLVDDVETLLVTLRQRDAELTEQRENLERLVVERTEELRAGRDEALDAARAKSEFLANMSHEIRTPLNGVVGVLSLLHDAPMNEEYRRLLDTAIHSADSLLLIINDILDFSKIDAGRITFESIAFDLRELMEETTEMFIDTVNLKNIELACFIPADVPCCIEGDPTRLRQIVTNLLSNAIKFTSSGEVSLTVSVKSRNGMQQELLFTVEDTGIGIADDAIDSLFDKFTQADGSTTRKYGGTGLGLSVCKQLIEQQGGEVGVKSRLGFGSTFWFTLPVRIAEDSCRMIPCGRLRGKRYLVLDDNRTSCRIVEHYLSLCGAEPICCSDTESALASLAEMRSAGNGVDSILIDFSLPDMNGLRFAEKIRQIYGLATPEMILLSSGAHPKVQLRRSGIRGMLLKPIRQHELYNLLAEIPLEQSLQQKKQPEKKTDTGLQGLVLLVDDEPVNQKIGLTILQRFGLQAEVAGTGREAVEKTSQKHYSAVLMDIQMPEMSGYEATEHIRKREALYGGKRTVIIAMTANAMELTRQRCLDVGMDDFFTKPIKPEVLAERLRPWLQADRDSSPVSAMEDEGKEDVSFTAKMSCWNRQQSMVFVGGDEELLCELIELFLSRNDKLLSGIESAIEEGSAIGIRDTAHAYKGAVNHFAAKDVGELAFSLENMGRNGDITGSRAVFKDLRSAAEQLMLELAVYLSQRRQGT